MNKVILLGNIGSDIERRDAGEHEVYSFSLATNKVIKKEKKTSWHQCTAWNKTGKFISDYFKKGDQILVEGEIDYQTYEKDGDTKYITKIIVNQAHFAGGKKSENSNNKKSSASEQW